MAPNNKIDVSQVVKVLNFFHPVSEGIVAYLEAHMKPKQFRKGATILKAGTICEYFYFIKKGAVRGFMIDNDKDITNWITAENELVTSISGLDLNVPSFENIEAIEECDTLAIKSTDMQNLYIEHPEANIIGRKLLQHYYRDAETRAYIVRLSNAEQKYNFFVNNYNHLANRIPLKFIASYLGITLETLSRVRKKISLGK